MLFLDLRKAFDTVDYKILIDKLKHYRTSNLAVKWFRSYISHHKQVIKVNQKISSEREITHSVPQGSILGLLLLTIYVNDMPNYLRNCKTNLYADDTAITINGSNTIEIETKLNESLVQFSRWFAVNKLSLNYKKSKFMVFSSKMKKFSYENFSVGPVNCH